MARERSEREDRGQSSRPPKDTTTRNQGGVGTREIMPPPVSRRRADSVQRAGNDGTNIGPPTSSQGSINKRPGARREPPPVPPTGRRRLQSLPGQAMEGPGRTSEEFGVDNKRRQRRGDKPIGPNRRSPVAENYDRPTPAPPLPAGRGEEQMLKEESMAMMGGRGGEKSRGDLPPSSPANVRDLGYSMGRGTGEGSSQPGAPGGSFAARSDRFSQEGPIMKGADGAPVNPPISGGPEVSAPSAEVAMNMAQAMPNPGRMGFKALGIQEHPQSQREPSGMEFQGEPGPGQPANSAGAVGMPGAHNTPEDIATNRQRFDQAKAQHKGDHFMAAQSTGSFPSGNPMAEGQKDHMKKIVESTDGDGVDVSGLDENTRRRYKQDAVRQLEEFGAYPGMDDPASPAPPVRPLSHSFNPFTGKWVNPEGSESLIDRFGGSK